MIVFICSEPLKGKMAGIAIRYTELARSLAKRDFNVHLCAPKIDASSYVKPDKVTCHEVDFARARRENISFDTGAVDAIVIQGHIPKRFLDLFNEIPMVVDLFDPYLIENMSYAELLGDSVFDHDHENWRHHCHRGDFFLCANEEQKLFYAGYLTSIGRIQPSSVNQDPALNELFGIVPFGIQAESGHSRSSINILPPRDNKITFRILFGGLYDWYNPIPVLEALNVAEFSSCQLLFVRSPNPDTTPQQKLREVEQWCHEKGWTAERVMFIDWVPYNMRFDLLREVDLMIATFEPSIETQLSFRTRFLDSMSINCPIISSPGGGMTRLLEAYPSATILASNDPEIIRDAIRKYKDIAATESIIINDPDSTEQNSLLNSFAWDQVIEPLVKFCSSPIRQEKNTKPVLGRSLNKASAQVVFSVLMPTYNRMDILPEVVNALEEQWNPPPFELIVVNDGSTDDTEEWLNHHNFKIQVKIIHQSNGGPANARNTAVRNASGDYLVLLGDDTVPERYWLNTHKQAHHNEAFDESLIVIGQIDWHEKMRRTPFIRFVDATGWQFAFDKIEDPRDLPFNYFYGSNVSFSASLLNGHRFNTSFPFPAWEDSELGYRLKQSGARIVFEPAARTGHFHKTTIARFANRQYKAGYCGMVFSRLHPEVGGLVWPSEESLDNASSMPVMTARRWFASFLEFLGASTPNLWNKVLRDHYVMGIRKYLSDNGFEASKLKELGQHPLLPLRYAASSPLLLHNTGKLENDKWVCSASHDEKGHCVFGPNFRTTRSEQLSVEFNLHSSANSDETQVATVDIYDNANNEVLEESVILADQLIEQEGITLSFCSVPGQQLEFRVYWHGADDLVVNFIELSQHA